jgi:N-acetylmuramoyl-L-alanine amidase
MNIKRIVMLAAALGAALFIFGRSSRAADGNFPIYFEGAKLVVKAETVNRTVYLPLREIIEFMGLPYTDSLALETLTIRSGNSRLVVTKNSGLISLNEQIIFLPSPILRENEHWLAPIDFLAQGLTRMTGTEFRYRSGTSRIFAGKVQVPEFVMNAQSLGPITRLTIRCGVPLNLRLQRDDQNSRAVLALDRAPVDPLRERLDHKDRLVRTISFDDADGNPKIIIDLTNQVADIKLNSTDGNRIFFVDFLRKGETITEAPVPPETPGTSPKVDPAQAARRVRVIVIDPGHGGMDVGAKGDTVSEKDLTLSLARNLRSALQMRLGTTVLLTRDSDIALDNEARSAVANNNQANLFVSLHAGYSSNKLDSSSSVYVMKEDFGDSFAPASVSRDRLFLPWYLGYRINRQASARAAKILQGELTKAISGSRFPVRAAPLAVLSSASMPSLLLEVGNLNNAVNAATLMDPGFQNRLAGAIAEAIRIFSETEQSGAN